MLHALAKADRMCHTMQRLHVHETQAVLDIVKHPQTIMLRKENTHVIHAARNQMSISSHCMHSLAADAAYTL